MTSSYDSIYSKFLNLLTDHKLLSLSRDSAYQIMGEILDVIKGIPKINRLFTDIIFDDEIMQVSYTLRDSLDNRYDKNFAENVFANAMVFVWYEKLTNTDTTIRQYFGDKETKFYSQSAHADSVNNLLNQARKYLDRDFIRNHGWNAWAINGD